MVCANYCASYPKPPCVKHEVNMCGPCCMMSFILEFSTMFLQVLWFALWLHHQVVTDVTVWQINPNPSCSKNRRFKNKFKKKNKISQVHFLWSWQFVAFQHNLVCENQSTSCENTSWMKFVTYCRKNLLGISTICNIQVHT